MRLILWIACKLHARLCLTSGAVKHLIISKITTSAQRDALWDHWKLGGVDVRKALLEKDDSNAAKSQFKRLSVSGNDEEKLERMLVSSLEIIYPPAERAADKIKRDNHKNAVEVIEAYKAVRASLSAQSSSFDTDNRVWGERVRKLACKFLQLWRAVVGKTKGLYLHVLTKHIPDMIAAVGDLAPYEMQGLEHGHKKRKRGAFEYTNCKPEHRGNSHMRATVVIDHLKKNEDLQLYAIGEDRKDQAKSKRRLKLEAERATP